jgi:hypothetical protein
MVRIGATNTPAHSAAYHFMRGVNLGNYLEADPGQGWSVPYAASEFAAMHAEGFDHVRIAGDLAVTAGSDANIVRVALSDGRWAHGHGTARGLTGTVAEAGDAPRSRRQEFCVQATDSVTCATPLGLGMYAGLQPRVTLRATLGYVTEPPWGSLSGQVSHR